MLKTKAWKPKVQGGVSNPKLEAPTQDFSQVVSRALVDIEPNEERRTFLHTRITEAQPSDGWANIAEAKALVETLDKVQLTHENPSACSEGFDLQLVERVTDKAVRDHCLRILSEICCENVILPESYVISNVSLRKKWKCGGVADIWTGKLEEEDVCIKVFRQHEPRQQERIKGVGKFSFWESVTSFQSFPAVLLLRNSVEVRFARKRAPFPGNFRGSTSVRPRQSSDARYEHSRIYQGKPRYRAINTSARFP